MINGRYYVVHHRTLGKIGTPISGSPKRGFPTEVAARRQHTAVYLSEQRRKKKSGGGVSWDSLLG